MKDLEQRTLPDGTVQYNLKNDFEVQYTEYPEITDTKGSVKSKPVSKFLFLLSTPRRSNETFAEFLDMSKGQQGRLKDVGGFIGGQVKKGRKNTDVANRCTISLDIDDVTAPDIRERIAKALDKYAYTLYSTRKHTTDKPRFRVVVYLEEPIETEKYEPIARMIASRIGIDDFDVRSFVPAQVMFYPSISSDGAFEFYHNDTKPISGEKVLNAYKKESSNPDAWKDPFLWPRKKNESEVVDKAVKSEKLKDPTTKKSIVGAFCRVYDIHKAIETFLSDVYVASETHKDRYTYVEGSTDGGLQIFEDGLFCISWHSTDPAGSGGSDPRVLNAFDLVRIHLFGSNDTSINQDPQNPTPTHKLPSTKSFVEYIRDNDEAVMQDQSMVDITDLGEEFADVSTDLYLADSEEDANEAKWISNLPRNQNGQLQTSRVFTFLEILSKDKALKESVKYNVFADTLETNLGDKWRDIDDTKIRVYIERKFNVNLSKEALLSAIETYAVGSRSYHPVKDYLESLEWDGVERIDTMFTDWLGADDSKFTKEASRLFMLAGVKRIYEPGCKFDYMPILEGKQGAGKSTFLSLLGKGQWHGELHTMDRQKAVEEIKGRWIVELVELAGRKNHSDDSQKSFLSQPSITYRKPYARRPEEHKLWFVLAGTTNKHQYLTDPTGNRRYWPIKVGLDKLDIVNFGRVVDQLWAEAMTIYKQGGASALFLSEEADIQAKAKQADKEDSHEWIDIIRDGLSKPVPVERYSKQFMDNSVFEEDNGGEDIIKELRSRVCVYEIAEDILGVPPKTLSPLQRNIIKEAMVRMESEGWVYKGSKAMSFGSRFGKQKGWVNPQNEF